MGWRWWKNAQSLGKKWCTNYPSLDLSRFDDLMMYNHVQPLGCFMLFHLAFSSLQACLTAQHLWLCFEFLHSISFIVLPCFPDLIYNAGQTLETCCADNLINTWTYQNTQLRTLRACTQNPMRQTANSAWYHQVSTTIGNPHRSVIHMLTVPIVQRFPITIYHHRWGELHLEPPQSQCIPVAFLNMFNFISGLAKHRLIRMDLDHSPWDPCMLYMVTFTIFYHQYTPFMLALIYQHHGSYFCRVPNSKGTSSFCHLFSKGEVGK